MRQYDFIIGIDPGYATAGIAVIDIRTTPTVAYLGSGITRPVIKKIPKKDRRVYSLNLYGIQEETVCRIYRMCDWLLSVLDRFVDPRFQARALLVLEDWQSSKYSRNAVVAYHRGAADMLMRHRFEARGVDTIMVDPIWVSQMSNPSGRFTSGKESPGLLDILTYVEHANPWLQFSTQDWIENQRAEHVWVFPSDSPNKFPTKDSVHYADALVMATMGYLATNRALGLHRSGKQQAVLDYCQERWNKVQDDLRQREGVRTSPTDT